MKAFFIILHLWARSLYANGSELCDKLVPVYETKILKQIETGIAFDMIVLIYQDHKMVCKKVLNYDFDLWKEQITLQSNGKKVGVYPINQVLALTCEQLQCKEKSWNHQNNSTIQVLLNPIWESQGKTSFRTKSENGIRFYRLDWNDILQDLPKEVEIINWELNL
jgi:hypothetical protein